MALSRLVIKPNQDTKLEKKFQLNEVTLNKKIITHKHLFFPYKKKKKKLFSEESKVTVECLSVESWQGPPHKHKVKEYESVLSFMVSSWIQFTYFSSH